MPKSIKEVATDPELIESKGLFAIGSVFIGLAAVGLVAVPVALHYRKLYFNLHQAVLREALVAIVTAEKG